MRKSPRPRILVVDDDPLILELISLALTDEGYEVETADDGRLALQIADRWPPDLILLDMRMPNMDGWEFAAALAARPGAQAGIVVLSAAEDARTLAQAIHAVGHVAKPFRIDDLLNAIERHLPPE